MSAPGQSIETHTETSVIEGKRNRNTRVRGQAMFILDSRSVLIGIIAILTMDVLSAAAIKPRLIAPLPSHLIGRWFASVARGQAFHSDIGQVPPIHHENGDRGSCALCDWSHLRARVSAGVLDFRAESAQSNHGARLRPLPKPFPLAAHVSGDGVWMVWCARSSRKPFIPR